MLADLSRIGQADGNPFNAPPLSTGAAAIGLPGHFIDGSYTNDAGTRDYKLYVPSSYTGQPSPLLVMLHGCTQHPDDFALGTGMNALAEEYGCLVVYPAQSQQANAHALLELVQRGRPAARPGRTVDHRRHDARHHGALRDRSAARCTWRACRPAARWRPSWARCIPSCTRRSACIPACRSRPRTTCRRRWRR